MFDALISYSEDQSADAMRLARELHKRGVKLAFNATGLPGEASWIERIADSFKRANNYIIIVSKAGSDKPHFSTEIALAISAANASKPRKNIIPVFTLPNVKIPPFLRQFKAVDLSDPEHYSQGVAQIENLLVSQDESSRKTQYASSSNSGERIDLDLAKIITTARQFDRESRSVKNEEIILERLSKLLSFVLLSLLTVLPFMIAFSNSRAWQETIAIISPSFSVIGFLLGQISGRGRNNG